MEEGEITDDDAHYQEVFFNEQVSNNASIQNRFIKEKKPKKEKQPKITIKPEALKQPLKIKDIQELILWVFADGINPKWAFVQV